MILLFSMTCIQISCEVMSSTSIVLFECGPTWGTYSNIILGHIPSYSVNYRDIAKIIYKFVVSSIGI